MLLMQKLFAEPSRRSARLKAQDKQIAFEQSSMRMCEKEKVNNTMTSVAKKGVQKPHSPQKTLEAAGFRTRRSTQGRKGRELKLGSVCLLPTKGLASSNGRSLEMQGSQQHAWLHYVRFGMDAEVRRTLWFIALQSFCFFYNIIQLQCRALPAGSLPHECNWQCICNTYKLYVPLINLF